MRVIATRLPAALAVVTFALTLLGLLGTASAQMPIDIKRVGPGGWTSHALAFETGFGSIDVGRLYAATDEVGTVRLAFDVDAVPEWLLDSPLRVAAGVAVDGDVTKLPTLASDELSPVTQWKQATRTHQLRDAQGEVAWLLRLIPGACTDGRCTIETIELYSLTGATLDRTDLTGTHRPASVMRVGPGDAVTGASLE